MSDLSRQHLKCRMFKIELTNLIDYIHNVDLDGVGTVTGEIFNRSNLLKEVFNKFQDSTITLLDKIGDTDTESATNIEKDLAATFEKYCVASSKYATLLNLHQPAESKSISQQDRIHSESLPPINLTTFDGKLENWENFKENFETLIHNNSTLNDSKRLHYLKTSLTKDALKLFQSLKPQQRTYTIVWKLLNDRFQNIKLIRLHHINSFIDLPPLQSESSNKLRNIIDDLSKHVSNLEELIPQEHRWDMLLLHIASGKLPKDLHTEWLKSPEAIKDFPTFEQLIKFLRDRAQLLETVNGTTTKPSARSNNTRMLHSQTIQCTFCSKSHIIYKCEKFIELSVSDRLTESKQRRLCLNCLFPGHHTNNCKSKNSCFQCKKRHNTLLHTTTQLPVEPQAATSNTISAHSHIGSQIALSTALVSVPDVKGHLHEARALLDCGSQNSFVTSSFANKLKLPQQKSSIQVIGVNGITTPVTKSLHISIHSNATNYKYDLSCYILPSISDKIPVQNTNPINTNLLPSHLKLADPQFNKSKPVDILIGADLFWDLLRNGRSMIKDDGHKLQKTTLGWIVAGQSLPEHKTNNNSTHNGIIQCYVTQKCSIQTQLQRFWEIENPSNTVQFSPEEIACEEHFKATTTKLNGRFCVDIPFKEHPHKLGDSKMMATKRFHNLERSLIKNPELKIQYHNFIKEYISLGHMSLNTRPNNENIAYFLPHHGVLKSSSTTTKLRVVFDGSAKTSTGVSLNEIQAVGPNLQSSLFNILLRFRISKFIVCADIEKMYRQVQIRDDQRNLQQILWRFSPEEDLKAYRLNTVTYGQASASFLAVRSLMQIGYDNSSKYPLASKSILQDFYVDDLITGDDNAEQLINKCVDIHNLLKQSGFSLRKWTSNSTNILSNLNIASTNENTIALGDSDNHKTLGIGWNPKHDYIKYKISSVPSFINVTKRTILSFIGTIFDPLGLMQPCIISFKIYMQTLWKQNLDWDEAIPQPLADCWSKLLNNLEKINAINIPRCIIIEHFVTLEMHGFADASERGYGACIYIKSIDHDDNSQVHLLCSKGRVAPVNTLSIPRLELCAAFTLAQLVNHVLSALNLNFNKLYLWTDSTIVLSWLKLSPSNLNTFVSNRVAKMQRCITQEHEWRHIPSGDNPADLISRGVSAEDILQSRLWWNGPEFLNLSNTNWPSTSFTLQNIPELRKVVIVNHSTHIDYSLLSKFSSILKLQRVIAFCKRFIHNCKNKSNLLSGPLCVTELSDSLNTILKMAQQQFFNQEIKSLRKGEPVSPSSKLSSLHAFIDNNGLIRVGGRLNNADIHYNNKHPIVLSSDSNVTKLIIRQEHLRLFHTGPQATLFSIRENYWPISGMNLIKGIIRNCVTCYKHKPTLIKPIMAALPADRFQTNFPFQITGVDFAGPIMIKNKPGRGSILIKAYISLFVCLSSKAIHLELVSDLTSESFINTLQRFISRRGKPTAMHSDNGTNFIGANKLLKQFLRETNVHIKEHLALQGITWKFLPPYSPHHGGLWESNIKSTKFHLKRILGNTNLTFEHTYTILAQIEAILNSRPLYPMSSDPHDLEPITPSHLLIGRTLTSLPMPQVADQNPQGLKLFRIIQHRTQHFWQRWRHDYLNHLQQRRKWKSSTGPGPRVGDLVIIKDDNLPPQRWTLGRITSLIPGKDNITRVCEIKTKGGLVKRTVHKLALLPNEH